jgi:hypothetical protein
VTIAGRTRVYVGVKVPQGAFGVNDAQGKASIFYRPKEVADWLRSHVLLPGEELADVTATDAHAEDAVRAAILRDAAAASVDPKTIVGTFGAATPVCAARCQPAWAQDLPLVTPTNPEPVDPH